MAPDDSDRIFEKALARHLRSSASSGPDSSALRGSPREACPDPETLAAYHDGSLSSQELTLWKQHVVACENCQLVLAHLATPLEIPVSAASKEPVLANQRPASSPASTSPAIIARPPRRPPSMRWLWLVPAGAAAAGLIAWISLNQQKPLPLAQPTSAEVAENRPEPGAAAPSAPVSRVVPPQHKDKDIPASRSTGAISSGSPLQRDDASKQLNNRVQSAQQAPNQYAGAPSHGPSLSLQNQQRQQTSGVRDAGATTGAAVLDQKKAATPSSNRQDRGKAAAPPPPPSSEPSFLADETVTPPAPAPQPAQPAPAPAASSGAAAASKTENVDAVSSASEAVEVVSPSQLRKSLRLAVLQDPHVFSAPDKKHLWRVGPVGLLEFSGSKGDKWKPQVSGVTTDLLAGFATSAKVAWAVGRSGTILRTTDGGILWIKLNAPEPADVAGIIATDALNAKIWFVPDEQAHVTRTYQTTDGGATWSMVPN